MSPTNVTGWAAATAESDATSAPKTRNDQS